MPKTLSKKIKYGIWDSSANLLLAFSVMIFRFLPPKSMVFMARILGTTAYYLIKKYRDRVLSNLSLAFEGEKGLEEKTKFVKEVFFNFTLMPLETIYTLADPFGQFMKGIKITGREYLDAALAKGNGVIALGSHMGAFTIVGTRLAMEGYPFNIIVNIENFPKIWKRLEYYQRRLGQKPFPPKPAAASVKKSLNCLRRNEILYLIADEQQIIGGLPVPFFGRTAYTPPGPAIFSLRTGAPILPMFLVRERGTPKTLFIEHPIEIERTFDEKKDAELLTAKLTRAVEDSIRRYPEQWPWLNRRWKQPYQKSEPEVG
jgi:KDO2-lipid IV(A) lauroyltransferase